MLAVFSVECLPHGVNTSFLQLPVFVKPLIILFERYFLGKIENGNMDFALKTKPRDNWNIQFKWLFYNYHYEMEFR